MTARRPKEAGTDKTRNGSLVMGTDDQFAGSRRVPAARSATAGADPRRDRLAQALRENLRKRKEQARERSRREPDEPGGAGDEAGDEGDTRDT